MVYIVCLDPDGLCGMGFAGCQSVPWPLQHPLRSRSLPWFQTWEKSFDQATSI